MQYNVRVAKSAAWIILIACSAPALGSPAAPAIAAETVAAVGTKLTQADLAGMFAISPDGAGLPAGHGSVGEGAVVYAAKCAACHGQDLEGMKAIGAPPLIGGRNSLATKPLKTVESYWPYATTLFDYVKRAMPMNAPGSLSDDEVYAVSAYILARAHIIQDASTVDAKTLPLIRMPNRSGFVDNRQGGTPR